MNIYKMGKKPKKTDHRNLQMRRYVSTAAPVPDEVSWTEDVLPIKPPMFLNDTLGCCTIATAGHMIMQWTKYASGSAVILPDSAILKAYEDVGGYVPGDPSTDNGCAILDVLNYWRKTGIGGHKITAFVEVDPRNATEMRQAIQIFGNVYIGIQLPLAWQGADSWTVPPGGIYGPDGIPGSWGGHAVPYMAASPQSRTLPTWDQWLKASPNSEIDYVDEMYAVVSPEWVEAGGTTPGGLNMAQLLADQAIVTA